MDTPTPNTVRLHRVLRAPPERVYRAFLDPDAWVKWVPPHGFTAKIHQLDARVGGSFRMSFTNFGTGSSHSFGGTYLELTPHTQIRYTDTFDDPNLPGEMQVTVTLRPVACGLWHRTERGAGGDSGGDSGGVLLPGLAGVAGHAGATGRARDSRWGLSIGVRLAWGFVRWSTTRDKYGHAGKVIAMHSIAVHAYRVSARG